MTSAGTRATNQKYYPSLEEVKRLGESANLVPVYVEINADLETPVSAYLKVARKPYSFLLESVEGGEQLARYSFIGTEPTRIVKTGPGQTEGAVDPLIPVEKALSEFTIADIGPAVRFNGGMVGYLSYEAVNYFERLPSPEKDTLGVPESIFMLTTTFVVFDHVGHKLRVVSHAHLEGDVEAAYRDAVGRIDELVDRLRGPLYPPAREPSESRQVTPNMEREQFEANVVRAKQYVVDGDIIQAVPSQRFARPTDANPFEIYRALRAINPSPYMYYLDLDGFQIVGASPEMLVQVEDGNIAMHPIAGTLPRGATDEEDAALEHRMRTDEKERAEHIMLLDLSRNDVGRVSEPGSVRVTELMEVERYSHVMHLVSHVEGKLRDDATSFDALRACFPAGTVSGAPKIRAMEIISELEPVKRGPYAGAVGYFDFSGNMDTAITIRTLVVKDGVAYAQAGGGIVFDSIPASEYEETIHKASAVMRAIDQAEGGG